MKKIFVNSYAVSNDKTEAAYAQQILTLKKVWADDTYGLERLLRLFLCLAQFVFPILLVREIFGRWGTIARRVAVEFYIFLKLVFPFLVLYFGLYKYHLVIVIIIYLLSETILHVLNLIFLSDMHSVSVSYHRSMLLLFLHYLEVVLDFGAIYIAYDLLSEKLSWVSAVYFSLVANATVGFGDIVPKGTLGQAVLIAQLLVGILFILLFINYFSQKTDK